MLQQEKGQTWSHPFNPVSTWTREISEKYENCFMLKIHQTLFTVLRIEYQHFSMEYKVLDYLALPKSADFTLIFQITFSSLDTLSSNLHPHHCTCYSIHPQPFSPSQAKVECYFLPSLSTELWGLWVPDPQQLLKNVEWMKT